MGEFDEVPFDRDPIHAGVSRSILWVLILLALFLPTAMHAQAVRFDQTADTTSSSCTAGKQCPLLVLPGTQVNFCTGTAATLAACLSSPATTYTNSGAGTPCSTTAQLTPATGGACLSTADNQGGYGAWLLPGNYSYYLRVPVTAGGGTYGPYPISVGASAGCPSSVTCDANYATLALACAAAGNGTLYLSLAWNGLTTQTLACNIEALALGKIQPASGQVITLTRSFSGTLTQHFDVSSGGSFASSSRFAVSAMYPQWWGAIGDNSTNNRVAFQNAYDNLKALNQTTLTVPRGQYIIGASGGVGINLPGGTTTVCDNSTYQSADTTRAFFIAGSDSMVMFKANGITGVGMFGCGFDGGSVTHSYTAVDGISLPNSNTIYVDNNFFTGFAASHTAIKGGGILYMYVRSNEFTGVTGRCVDIQNSYSSGGTSYGVNVGSFRDNVGSSCAQGYRISGTFTFDSNNAEVTLPTGTRAVLDFSEDAINTYATLVDNYIEAGSTSGTGYGVYFGGGILSITGGQINFTHGGTNKCISLDTRGTLESLFGVTITGVQLRSCQSGIFINNLPVHTGGFLGSTLIQGNLYYSATTGCEFGPDMNAGLFYETLTSGQYDCPEYAGVHSYTPTLSFGGASTGITYSAQSGTYQQIGGLMYVTARVELTSKGSATGAARVSYPIAPSGVTQGYGAFSRYGDLSGITSPYVRVDSSFGFTLDQNGAVTNADLTNSNFSNTSYIWIFVTYTP